MIGFVMKGQKYFSRLLDVDVSSAATNSTLILGGDGKWTTVKNNLAGTTAPGVGDDSADGYSAGSLWFDTTSSPKEVYRCLDATEGAAVWINTSLEVGELGSAALLAVDTDGALTANSDSNVASQKATKTYADTKTTLTAVKADTDVADAISKKHSQNTDTGSSAESFGVKVIDFKGTSETIVAHGNTGTDAQEIDLADGSYHTMTVTGDFTISFANWPSGKVGTVIVKFVNGGSQTITWPAAIAGTDPVLQASGTDFCAFWSDDDGTTIYFSQISIV